MEENLNQDVPQEVQSTPVEKKQSHTILLLSIFIVLIVIIVGVYFFYFRPLPREGEVIVYGKILSAELPNSDSEGYFSLESKDYGEVKILYRPAKILGECPNINVDGVGIHSAVGDEVIVKGRFISDYTISACTDPDNEIYNKRYPTLSYSQEILKIADSLNK